VGAAGPRLVDRRAVRRRLIPLRARHGACLRERRGRQARRGDVLRRITVLYLGRFPAVPRGGRCRARAAGHSPSQGLRVPAPSDRLAGDRRATHRDTRVQHQHLRRHLGGERFVGRAASRLASRRPGLGVLPGRQCARVVRGLPRLGRMAAPVLRLVDHGGQSGRVGRVRVLGPGQLRRSGDHGTAERAGGEPRHLRRRSVFLRRRGASALRADRASARRPAVSAARARSCAGPAVTGRATSSGRRGRGRSCGGGSLCPG